MRLGFGVCRLWDGLGFGARLCGTVSGVFWVSGWLRLQTKAFQDLKLQESRAYGSVYTYIYIYMYTCLWSHPNEK